MYQARLRRGIETAVHNMEGLTLTNYGKRCKTQGNDGEPDIFLHNNPLHRGFTPSVKQSYGLPYNTHTRTRSSPPILVHHVLKTILLAEAGLHPGYSEPPDNAGQYPREAGLRTCMQTQSKRLTIKQYRSLGLSTPSSGMPQNIPDPETSPTATRQVRRDQEHTWIHTSAPFPSELDLR